CQRPIVKAALRAMTVKTGRNDARGMVQLMRCMSRHAGAGGSGAADRTEIAAGKQLQDIELGIRGLLRGFALKVGQVSKGKYEAQSGSWRRGSRCWNQLRWRCCKRGRASEPNMPSCTRCYCASRAMTRSVGDL